MEQLMIRELAPYLPYDVKFVSELDKPYDEFGKNPIWTFDGISKLFGDYCATTKENSDAYPIQLIKPILRPLSNVNEIVRSEFGRYDNKMPHSKEVIDLFSFEKIGVENITDLYDVFDAPYNTIQWLLENHFDVFGLIDQNLAIDINTIKPTN